MATHFKKLTDCPENLRESIDWLIQVKHGGNGQGLNKLAEALKKLIEEALHEAYTTNVSALLKALDSAKSYNCCKDKVTEVGNLIDLKNIENNLFNDLKTKSENIKNCYKGHLDSSQQKSYDDIVSKLEQLKNLNEGLIGLTNEHQCKELLENLCSGLEIFLGFNSASKGYTGEGIVYSDLDRLCDAVMAFLKGLLDGVKTDDAVITYDSYIPEDDNRLKSVLDTLTSSIGTGSTGLVESVDIVKRWLGGYEEKVVEMTGKITKPLTSLSKHIGKNLEQFKDPYVIDPKTKKPDYQKPEIRLKNNFIVDNVEKRVTDSIDEAKNTMRAIFESENAALNVLDPGLRGKIREPIKIIRRELNRFRGSSERDRMRLEQINKMIVEVLEALRKSVNDRMKSKVEGLVGTLKQKVKEIQLKLENIRRMLGDYLDSLSDWVKKALENIDVAKVQINAVLDAVVEGNSDKILARIIRAAEQIGMEASVLHGQFESAKSEYDKLFTVIKGDKGDGKGKDGGIMGQLQDFKGEVNEPDDLTGFQKGGDDAWDLSRQIDSLLQKIKENVEEYLEALKGALTDGMYVTEQRYGTAGVTPGVTPVLDALVAKIGKHTELKPLGARLETARDDSTGQGHSLEKVLKQLYDAKQDLKTYPRMLEDIYGKIKSSFQEKAAAADEELGALLNAAAVSGVVNLQAQIEKAVITKLKPLKNEVRRFVSLAEQSKQGLIDHAADVLGKFSELTADIINKGGQADGYLEAFKTTTIGDQLQKIQREIDALKKNHLMNAIENTDKFMIEAKNELDKTVRQLEDYFNQKVKEATSTLTTETEKQYVDSRIHEMSILNTVVQKQYGVITDIMYQDKITGIKGLLRKLGKKFIANMESITDIKATYTIPLQQSTAGLTFNSQSQNTSPLSKAASILRKTFEKFLDDVSQLPGVSAVDTPFNDVSNTFQGLLLQIESARHFDYLFTSNLKALEVRLYEYNAETFSNDVKNVLSPLKAGLHAFAEQVGHVYVNRYSGQTFKQLTKPVEPSKTAAAPEKPSIPDYDLTPEGRNCAKVCLTIVEMLNDSWWKLIKACKNNSSDQINLDEGKRLGFLFYSRGYSVATERSKQDGELQNDSDMTGVKIQGLCEAEMTITNSNALLGVNKTGSVPFYLLLRYLNDRVNDYSGVCHLRHIGSPKAPKNVNQMLHWLAGLRHSAVYGPLCKYFKQIIPKPKEYKETPYDKIPDEELNLPATVDIKYTILKPTLAEVCSYARRLLICIFGHGHADGRYACEFSTNADGLEYPSSSSSCFDTLVDILNRLYDQLYFVYVQCYRESDDVSWRDCWYGRYVGGSDWRCNEKQCPNQMGGSTCPQIANQTADQKCDQHPKCGLKSPLQSFLEDGLQGFLPHSFSKPGCKLECTVSNHRGIPCKTPMGFADISVTASRTSKGERIMKVLGAFCGQHDSPLTKLCGVFICLLQKPPQTLGDMFSFYFCYLNEWGTNSKEHKKGAFDKAVAGAYFGVSYPQLNVSSIWLTSNHEHKTHGTGDLYSLYSCDHEGKSEITCGRYMKPCGLNTWLVFSSKNANRYLSWIVYLTETFYDLLDKLYKDCCNNCNSPGTKCHSRICPESCEVKCAYEANNPSKQLVGKHHTKDCKSIAQCAFTRPTLYNYGFVLNSLTNLNGRDSVETKRTCADFCRTLEKVISKNISDGAPLAKLIYVHIPEFLWKIREPFSYLVLALWTYALLYLLHIMVIRLDLLHIKSHLHSPSSHRIAAQSLLAAARVKSLNKVLYLQP